MTQPPDNQQTTDPQPMANEQKIRADLMWSIRDMQGEIDRLRAENAKLKTQLEAERERSERRRKLLEEHEFASEEPVGHYGSRHVCPECGCNTHQPEIVTWCPIAREIADTGPVKPKGETNDR